MLFSFLLIRWRAEVVTELLCEMNPDAVGNAVSNSIKGMIESEPTFLKQFSLVILANQPEIINLDIARLCWSYSLPLIIVRSLGYIGYIRLQLRYCFYDV